MKFIAVFHWRLSRLFFSKTNRIFEVECDNWFFHQIHSNNAQFCVNLLERMEYEIGKLELPSTSTNDAISREKTLKFSAIERLSNLISIVSSLSLRRPQFDALLHNETTATAIVARSLEAVAFCTIPFHFSPLFFIPIFNAVSNLKCALKRCSFSLPLEHEVCIISPSSAEHFSPFITLAVSAVLQVVDYEIVKENATVHIPKAPDRPVPPKRTRREAVKLPFVKNLSELLRFRFS